MQKHKAMQGSSGMSKRTTVGSAVLELVSILLAMIIFLPILWMACVSLKTDEASMPSAFQYFVPPFTVQNYTDVLTGRPQVVRWVLNSFGVAAIVTVLTTLLCAMASYAMAKLKFRYSKAMYIYFLIGLMVPGEATIISNYLTVSRLGLLNTYTVLIVPSLTSAMGIFLFRQFYLSFPISLYESAKLDGCSNLYFIVKILMPLTKSAIGAMAVYTFINAWNMYLWPLLVTGSDSMRTVQIGISMLNAVDAQSISLTMAGIVICMLPSLIIFVVGQKQMIRGMFSGAVKG